jgi:hypothetical protein
MAQCTPKSFDLTGKVALITGASYGIGMAIAKAMAANGATIVFNDIKQELVDKGIAAYEEAGIKAHGYVCDVTDEDAVNAMVAKITEEVGHINILVNNAGIIKRIPMTEMTAAQFRQVIDVDLNAPFIVAKAVIPDMIAQGGGKIINICSMMSELGRETVSAYAAAKGGLKMPRTSPPSTASTTSSATASDPATSLPRRPHLCASVSPTAAVIPSTASSSPRPPQAAGARLRIWADPLSSWLLPLPTSSTASSCTLTAVSWLTSASSRSKFFHIRHFCAVSAAFRVPGTALFCFPYRLFFRNLLHWS